MQVNVERNEGGEAVLRISLEPEAVSQEVQKVFSESARRVTVPGFRPGRAPRAMIEAKLNMEAIREEALERLTHTSYLLALEETGLEPIDRATVEERKEEEDGGLSFLARVPTMPEVKLGEYRGLKAERPSTEVDEAAVAAELEKLRNRFASYESRPDHAIETGDTAIIDYELEVAEKKIAEAAVSGYPLEVGTDMLFPELNEGLLGAKEGEERRIEGKLPKSYNDKELAGKEATFIVKIRDIKTRQVPELNDEFARRIAQVDGLEELQEKMRESLESFAVFSAEESVREQLLTKAAEGAEVEIPALLVERFKAQRESEASNELQRQGLNLESYLASRGQTYAAWTKEVEKEAQRNLKRHLVLREIGRKETIAVSSEEIDKEIGRLAEREDKSLEVKRRELESENRIDEIADYLQRQKVIELLIDSADISDQAPNTEESPAQETPAQAAAEPEPKQSDDSEHGKE